MNINIEMVKISNKFKNIIPSNYKTWKINCKKGKH